MSKIEQLAELSEVCVGAFVSRGESRCDSHRVPSGEIRESNVPPLACSSRLGGRERTRQEEGRVV